MSVIKIRLPVGAIHFANIYKPLQLEGASRPMYGFSIDREFLQDDERFDELFNKTPGSKDKNAIPATCKRPPKIETNNIDKLVDAYVEAQATNQSGDCGGRDVSGRYSKNSAGRPATPVTRSDSTSSVLPLRWLAHTR